MHLHPRQFRDFQPAEASYAGSAADYNSNTPEQARTKGVSDTVRGAMGSTDRRPRGGKLGKFTPNAARVGSN